MMLLQLTGLSGAGKTTLSEAVKKKLVHIGYRVEILDGDTYRKKLWPDLGFTKEDRTENIRRLGFIANLFTMNEIIAIIAAINPYESTRNEVIAYGRHVKTVWIDCDLNTLLKRDTKHLYKKAMLPEGHPDKIKNLSGINDPYEVPENPDLIINTTNEDEEKSAGRLYDFIIEEIRKIHSLT